MTEHFKCQRFIQLRGVLFLIDRAIVANIIGFITYFLIIRSIILHRHHDSKLTFGM